MTTELSTIIKVFGAIWTIELFLLTALNIFAHSVFEILRNLDILVF